MKKLRASDIQLITGDSVKVSKGVYTVGKSYFYRTTALTDFRDRVESKLHEAGLSFERVNYGDKFKPFRGGDNVWQGSHFWYQFKLVE
jgi:hypothetical protein